MWDEERGWLINSLLGRLRVLFLVPTTAVMVPRRGVEEEGCWDRRMPFCQSQQIHHMLDSALEGPAVLHRWEPTAVPETGTTSLGFKMDRKRDGQVLPATHLSLKRVPWFWLTAEDPLIIHSSISAPIPPPPCLRFLFLPLAWKSPAAVWTLWGWTQFLPHST